MTAPKPPSQLERIPGPALLEGVEWLLSQDVHPALICQELGRTAGGIAAAARRHNRPDLATAFASLESGDREKRRNARAA